MKEKKKIVLKGSFVAGSVALLFLTIGYQIALFVHSAAVAKIASDRDAPDTVFVFAGGEEGDRGSVGPLSGQSAGNRNDGVPGRAFGSESQDYRRGRNTGVRIERRSGAANETAQRVRDNVPRRRVENFSFDPNTASLEDMQRLGFSPKQAQSIENYRAKGGRFRRKADFAKSFVVSDSIYRRLEPYIDIPRTDLNLADSAAFDALPGIGGYFARKMVEYREKLGGSYSRKEQLLEIYNFDREKFDALSDLVCVRPEYVRPYPLWTLPADSLAKHPYIRSGAVARGIVLYRDNNPKDKWTVEALRSAGVISDSAAQSLSLLSLAPP